MYGEQGERPQKLLFWGRALQVPYILSVIFLIKKTLLSQKLGIYTN